MATKTFELPVHGMSCASCVARVEKVLSQMCGAVRARVKRVRVEYDAAHTRVVGPSKQASEHPLAEAIVLNLIFLGEQTKEAQRIRPSRQWQIEEPHFIPLEDLPSIDLCPPIGTETLEDAVAERQGPIRFLGNLWRDMDEVPEWRGSDESWR